MANILEEVQRYVADKLNADEQLSGCTFLVENMKDIDYEIKKVLGKQGLVGLVMTPKAVYQGKYEDLFLAWQLDELEIDIVENPIINRGQLSSHITGQDAAMRLFDVLCPAVGDSEGQFNPVSYEEGEDSGLIVNKCILKALVYGESQDPPQPTPSLNMRFVKLLEEAPPLSVTRQDGWMWPTDDGFVIWQDGEPKPLGGGVSYDEMSAYVDSHLSDYLPLSGGTLSGDVYVDSDVAVLRNGNIMGMLTHNSGLYGKMVLSAQLDDNYSAEITPFGIVGLTGNGVFWPTEDGTFALTKDIPLSVSQLSNDSGYLTSADVQPYTPIAGWARYANQANYVTTRNTFDNGLEFPVSLETVEEGTVGKAKVTRTYMRDWSLHYYSNNLYNPPLPMEWQMLDLYRIRAGRRTNVYRGYGWITQKDSAGRQYALAIARNSRDTDPTLLFYDDGTGTEFNLGVTVGYNNQLATSLSTSSGLLSCTRITIGQTSKTTYLATVDELPTLVSQLSNDAGYITSADIPPVQLSCIQDEYNNIINANREFISRYPTAPWTLYDANVKVCELSCESINDRWLYIEDEYMLILSIQYGQHDEAIWLLQHFQLEAGRWVLNDEYSTTEGAYDGDSSEITFNDSTYSATRKNIVSGILANYADIPLSVSQLSNDSGYITSAYPVKNDGGIQKAVAMTEAQYEAISATADLSTLYVITED